MKKLYATVFATFFAFTINTASADVSGLAIGITLSDNELDTTVTDDIDSNGTINTTKELTDTILAGSIFAELTLGGSSGPLAVTLGVDYIPVDADLDKRSASQASIKGAGTSTSGTNTGKASVTDHFTFYIQPGYVVGNNMFYGTLGYSRADIEATWESISSTNTTKVQKMTGTKIGVGVKHVRDSGVFLKLDYSETDYDKVSYVTTNNTTVTGDIDNQAIALSIGKSF